MIGEVSKRDRGEAQDLGRHKDMGMGEEAYRHLDVEEQSDRLDDRGLHDLDVVCKPPWNEVYESEHGKITNV